MRCLSVFLFVCATLRAGNGVQAGNFVVERPTLICLGFEWEISGDDNRNAAVDVSYRRSGATEWKQALPLLRIGGERIFRAAEHLDYTVPDRFAGSVLRGRASEALRALHVHHSNPVLKAILFKQF